LLIVGIDLAADFMPDVYETVSSIVNSVNLFPEFDGGSDDYVN
jgi:hypothetical protein